VQNSQATTLFTEPWVDNTAVETLAGQTHRQVRDLDTLLGPPAGGWPAGATYINLMEANLGTLNNALGCGADSTS
jgi:ABC-type Zn uptake system ZnuABC Zn-binding protein ZnuA